MFEVRSTRLVPLCNLTTLDLTPFLDEFTACVESTGLSHLCDPMLLADWEDLAFELERLLLLVDITGVEITSNLVIFLSSAAFSSDVMCVQ